MSPPILPLPQQSVPYFEPALLVQPVACRVCSVARLVNLVRCQGCLVFSDRWDLVCRLYRLLSLFRWRLHRSLRLLWLPFNLSCLPLNLFYTYFYQVWSAYVYGVLSFRKYREMQMLTEQNFGGKRRGLQLGMYFWSVAGDIYYKWGIPLQISCEGHRLDFHSHQLGFRWFSRPFCLIVFVLFVRLFAGFLHAPRVMRWPIHISRSVRLGEG